MSHTIAPPHVAPSRTASAALGLMIATALGGCTTDEPASAVDGGDAGAADDPAVMLSVRVQTPDDRVFYVGAFPEVPSGELDLGALREFSGPSDASTFGGHVFVSDQESGVMTRFSVDEDFQLVEGPSISFASQGATGYLPPAYIDETRAYVLSPQFDAIVVWDPSAMEITGTIEMTPPEVSGFVPAGDGRPVRVGDHIAWDFNAVDWDSLEYHRAATVLLAPVDGSGPPIVAQDDRCMFGTFQFVDDRGDLYFFATGFRGYFRFYGPEPASAPPFCVLRIKNGETRFDPDFMVVLEDVTGSPAIHGMWPIAERKYLVLAWPPEVPMPENPDDIFAQELDPLLLDLDALTATPFSGLSRMPAGNVRQLRLDEQPYFQRYDGDRSEVELGPLTLDAFTPVLTTRGDVLGMERIR